MNSNDKRFTKIGGDPKFKRVPKADRKVKIDKRFQSIFNDKRFKVKYTIDKRGKPLRGSTTEDFKKFYHMSDEEAEDEEKEKDDDTDSEQDSNEDDDVSRESDDLSLVKEDRKTNGIDRKIKKQLKDKTIDYARGDGEMMSDSSSDDTSSDEENQGNSI